MKRLYTLGTILGLIAVLTTAQNGWAKPKTGVLEKVKIDGDKIEIFTDTVYDYKLTTPVGWDFSVQKEKGDDELNEFRLRMRMKDKQIPAQAFEIYSVHNTSPEGMSLAYAYLREKAEKDQVSTISRPMERSFLKSNGVLFRIRPDSDIPPGLQRPDPAAVG